MLPYFAQPAASVIAVPQRFTAKLTSDLRFNHVCGVTLGVDGIATGAGLHRRPGGAPDCTFPRPYDPGLAIRVVELGRSGRTHAQIAVELGFNLDDFAAWSADHPEFATALADASCAAYAFWDGEAAAAVKSGKPFRANLWAKFIAQSFGRTRHPPRRTEKDAAQKPVVLARVNIPDNGRKRRSRPGG